MASSFSFSSIVALPIVDDGRWLTRLLCDLRVWLSEGDAGGLAWASPFTAAEEEWETEMVDVVECRRMNFAFNRVVRSPMAI